MTWRKRLWLSPCIDSDCEGQEGSRRVPQTLLKINLSNKWISYYIPFWKKKIEFTKILFTENVDLHRSMPIAILLLLWQKWLAIFHGWDESVLVDKRNQHYSLPFLLFPIFIRLRLNKKSLIQNYYFKSNSRRNIYVKIRWIVIDDGTVYGRHQTMMSNRKQGFASCR